MLKFPTNPATKKQLKEQARKQRSLARWLRERVADTVFGQKTAEGVKHTNTKKRIIAFYNNGWAKHLKQIRHRDILAHLKGQLTLYFSGAWRRKEKYSLVLIDIDVQKSKGLGTTQGAWAFAKILERYFPGLICEASTNGKGVHAYIVVEKEDCHPDVFYQALHKLQEYLRGLADLHNADIELVEVKGGPTRFKWDQTTGKNSRLLGVTLGSLAKLPRSDIRSTHQCHVAGLLKLVPPAVDKQTKKRTSGSCRPLSQEYLDALPGIEKMAQDVFDRGLEAGYTWQVENSRQRVTVKDLAAFILCLKFFSDNPNEGDYLPVERFRGLWNAAYQAGSLDRAFCFRKLRAIRDGFSLLGYLDWIDETYHFFAGGNKQGKACQWAAGQKFISSYEAYQAGKLQDNQAHDTDNSQDIPDPKQQTDIYTNTKRLVFIKPTLTFPIGFNIYSDLDPHLGYWDSGQYLSAAS